MPMRRRGRRRLLGTVVALSLALMGVEAAHAQARFRRLPEQRNKPNRGRAPSSNDSARASELLLEPAPPVANLLSRAEEGIARGDWKFTIDCLQRVIDDPAASMLPREGVSGRGIVFDSARKLAQARLASLPPEALRAYRLLHDGKAKRLYEGGRARGDVEALHAVIERYLLTQYGDDAADLLASWALDAGQAAEVVSLIEGVLSLSTPHDVPETLLLGKLAAAYALLGRDDDAASLVDQLEHLGDTNGTPMPASWRAALTAIRPARYGPTVDSPDWLMDGGSPARRALMPPVQPTLAEPVPWRVTLPDTDDDTWRRVLTGAGAGPLYLPVGQLVTASGRVFARTPHGCVALDRADLSLQWYADVLPVERPDPAPSRGRGGWGGPHAALNDLGIAFDDYAAGGISLGHDQVYIVSREGMNEYVQAQRDARQRGWLSWTPLALLGQKSRQGTRLIALDQQSGKVRWQRGRTVDQRDPVGDVFFHSVPITVGDKLWAPYSRQGDLYLAVLDASDGTLLRSVALYDGRRGEVPTDQAVPLAAGAGLVFVPVGDRLMFAVDARDGTIRWANQFNAAIVGKRRRSPTSPGWLPLAPVVSGGVVLMTPPGDDEMLAFDMTSGEVVWSVRCPKKAYVIAADRERVWLGGRSLSCRSIRDGSLVWGRELDVSPSGRAVRSGTVLHVPTLDGLLSVNADNGESLGMLEVPASQAPLGNLLCSDNALFTIHSNSVRKFPDVDRAYPPARERHERDKTDVKAATRLAWLEILRGQPEAAYEILSGVSAETIGDQSTQAQQVAHARVESLLAMAVGGGSASRDDEEVLSLVEAAHAAALSATDRLRCSAAMADTLVRIGRPVEAYRRLWAVGLSEEAELQIALDHHVDGRARVDIARRLAAIAANTSDEQRAAIARIEREDGAGLLTAQALVETPAGRRKLRAVAELSEVGAGGQQALLALGRYHADRDHFAQAEQWLRDSVARDVDAESTLDALIRLALLYADARITRDDRLSRLPGVLDSLESRFGAFSVGDALARIDAEDMARGVARTVGDWAVDLRADYAPPDAADHRPGVFHLSDKPAWSISVEGGADSPCIVHSVKPGGVDPGTRLLLIDPGDVLSCYDARDRTLLWRTRLRLPGKFRDFKPVRFQDHEDAGRLAAVDGQTAVVAGRDGLFAIEMSTGRRLWVRPFSGDPPPETALRHDWRLSAGDGLIAMMPRFGRLTVARLADGSTVWERDLLGGRVLALQMIGDRIVVVDDRLRRAHIFARDDGRLIKRILFDQPDPQGDLVELLVTDGVLCGPVVGKNLEFVKGIDIETGEPLWRIEVEKPLVQLFEPKLGYVGIGLLGGDVIIVEAATGEEVIRRRITGAHGVTRAAMVDGTLLVQHFNDRTGIRAASLSAIDVATHSELWDRDDVTPLWLGEEQLRLTGGRMPVLIQGERRDGRRIVRTPQLTTIDIRTGEEVGERIALSSGRNLGRYGDEFLLLPNAEILVISTQKSVQALRLIREPGPTGRDF